MYARVFLHKLLSNVIHLRRLNVLILSVMTLIDTKQLQLTSLGRRMDHPIQERSRIRKMDRLLGNQHLQRDYKIIYKTVANLIVGNKSRPQIIVDWTKLPNCNHYVLRAALATEARALTLYEERHPKKKEGNAKVHKNFLKTLKQLLPEVCNAIIITDAGFKNPWFKEVKALGWDFIGRIRGRTTYSENGEKFMPIKRLFKGATKKIKYLGEKTLARKNPMMLPMYLVKGKAKLRHKLTKKGVRSKEKDSLAYSRSHREPWLLVSSLKGKNAAKKVNEIYKRRMSIEEAFRDLKSIQYGFSLASSRTIKVERYIVLLLIALLACLICWLTGRLAEEAEIHYQYQANSIKHRRVLSWFYLGCQVLRDRYRQIKLTCTQLFELCQVIQHEFITL